MYAPNIFCSKQKHAFDVDRDGYAEPLQYSFQLKASIRYWICSKSWKVKEGE